jgi:hypothetical protein
MTDGHIKVHVNLSKAQVAKARNGHQIQLAHNQIGSGHQVIHAHPELHKKLHTAYRKGTGARIHLTHHEMAHGSGFFDVLKSIASPVLSGLQGVANELFPGHKNTINSIREGIRGATGYGLKPRKQNHKGHAMHSNHDGFSHGDGIRHFRSPEHFPGENSDHYGFGVHHKKHTKKHNKRHGSGILPSGYGY